MLKVQYNNYYTKAKFHNHHSYTTHTQNPHSIIVLAALLSLIILLLIINKFMPNFFIFYLLQMFTFVFAELLSYATAHTRV